MRGQQAFRIAQCAARLANGAAINAPRIRQEYGVSRATARRDLDVLETALPLLREAGVLRWMK